MTMGAVIAALSAAVAVIGWGCLAACARRLYETWGDDARRTALLAGITIVALGLAGQQSLAVWAWETGLWTGPGTSVPLAVAYRVLWGVGLLLTAAAASYPAFGHRAWRWLAVAGAASAGLSLMV